MKTNRKNFKHMKKFYLSFLILWIFTISLTAQNYALKFVERNDVVVTGNDDGAENWTIEFWVKKLQNTSYSTIINGQSGKIMLESWGNGQKMGITKKGVADWAFNYVLPTNTWTHVAVVSQNSSTKLYINSILTDEMPHSIPQPLYSFSMAGESPNMIMDEVRFWNYARTQDQIAANYLHSVDINSSGLIGYYYLDDQADQATDLSPLHNNGIIQGAEYVINDNPDFTTTLPDMSYSDFYADNYNEYFVQPGAENQDVVRMMVITDGVNSPLHLTKITANLDGTTDLQDISHVKLFYTGNSPRFTAEHQFGETLNPGADVLEFNDNITLLPGSNYFWLALDISSNATTGNRVDGTAIEAVVNNTSHPVGDESDFSGKRFILDGIPQAPSARNAIVPKPQFYTIDTSQKFILTDQTKIIIAQDSITSDANEFSSFLQKATGYPCEVEQSNNTQGNISLQILDSWNDDIGKEGYFLTCNENGVTIQANTLDGLFYGTQTLRQLLPANIESSLVVNNVVWDVPFATITDKPRYSWRGLHFDVSRHFFSVDFIKKYLDIMAFNKLNRFHWHLTDDQGWRIEILSKPLLQTISAWRTCNGETYGGYYTQEQITEIVNYAAKKHIMVIPEMEMPGHTVEVLAAYPELSCATATQPHGGPFNVRCAWGTSADIFCAGKEATFEFIEDVLTEICDLFPAPYIHLGGDEAVKDRWEQCPDCQARIQEEGLANEEELQRYFMERVGNFLATKGKKWIGWSEITYGGVPENATVMSWLGESSAVIAAQQGHDAILTPYNVLYLDARNSDDPDEPPAIGYAPNTIEEIYAYDPMPSQLNQEQQQYILGPQSCLWTEFISEEWHAEYMILPRIFALAEIGWTAPPQKDFDEFRKRIYPMFQRLDLMNYTYRPLDFPDGDILPPEISTCNEQVTLEINIPATSFYWNDSNHTTSSKLTVTQSGTYKCYINYLNKIYEVSTKVTFKEPVQHPAIDTTDQGWNANGNADNYLWYFQDQLVHAGQSYTPPDNPNPTDYSISGVQLINKKDAVNLTGNDDYIQFDNADFLNNTQHFTLEAWMNVKSYPDWAQVFTKRESLDNRISVEFLDNRIYFEIGNGNNTYAVTQSPVLKKNEWHHYAFVFDGTASNNEDKMKIYVDGEEKNLLFAGTMPGTTSANNVPLTIGTPEANPSMEITEIRVWNKSMNANEINIRKDIQLTGNETDLQYYLKTEEESGSLLENVSANNSFNAAIQNFNDINRINGLLGFLLYSCESQKWNVGYLITDINKTKNDAPFQLAPNPARQSVTIIFTPKQKSTITINIYNMTGKKVLAKNLGTVRKLKTILNISDLEKGYYIVELSDGSQSYKKSLIVL